MDLGAHIKQLLFEHDCVVIPDFGGFVCQVSGSKLSKESHRISAPNKHISFNKSLQNNDALLAKHIQTNESLSYDAALMNIREAVLVWKSALQESGRIQIEGVGTLFVDGAKKWQFSQSADVNFNLDAYGLPSIKLDPISIKLKEDTKVIQLPNKPDQEEDKVIELKPKLKKRRVAAYAIAAACILPIAFYSYWLPMKTNAFNRGYVMASDFNPLTSKKLDPSESEYAKRTLVEFEPINATSTSIENHEIEVNGRRFTVVDKTAVANPNKLDHEVETTNNQGSYHLIGGCFSKQSNADGQIEFLKAAGFNSYILDVKGGLTRVCVGSYNSAAEAKVARIQLEALGKSAWILKK